MWICTTSLDLLQWYETKDVPSLDLLQWYKTKEVPSLDSLQWYKTKEGPYREEDGMEEDPEGHEQS